jgi:hypothetical protein
MTRRRSMIILAEFFKKQGKMLTLDEYRKLGDKTPIKDFIVRRYFGTWARALSAVHVFLGADAFDKVEPKEESKPKVESKPKAESKPRNKMVEPKKPASEENI